MDVEQPYDVLRRKWIRARQILRSLTPEAGETYQFYVDLVAKLDAQFVEKKPLWPPKPYPRSSRSTGLRQKREKKLAVVEERPVEFRVEF